MCYTGRSAGVHAQESTGPRGPAAAFFILIDLGWTAHSAAAEHYSSHFPIMIPIRDNIPSRTTPLVNYSLPRLLQGDIARNWGTVAGLPGWASLLPLVVILGLLFWRMGVTLSRATLTAE